VIVTMDIHIMNILYMKQEVGNVNKDNRK